jgi:phosphomannomutase
MLIFDLDDTLAPSKSPVPARMAALLTDLLADREVCIISGGRFEQFQMQVLDHLDASTLRHRLHIMPTCGTQYFRWDGEQWAQQYAQNLSDDEKQRATAALEFGARKLGLWEEHTWGPRIEDRGSQITFSALGQSAPVAAKSAWDPSGSKKDALRRYAADRLPDLEVRSGGSTSVDITRKGIDKAYGVRQLCSILGLELADLHFVGDRLDPGGNDYPVLAMGVSCTAVRNWQDTADYVARLLGKAPTAA